MTRTKPLAGADERQYRYNRVTTTTLAAGSRLGPYEIQTALGAGGMGEVYRAHDSRLGRDVAIKVLPAAYGHDPERLARLEQEARALSALNHPNILAIYDIGERDGLPFLVTELVEGKTLRQVLEPPGTRLPVRRAIDCGLQIAHAFAAAHARGVLHRDLKPENIVITADWRAKVLDFGLARLVIPDASVATATTHAITNVGSVLGTMGYMPPEQVRGQPVDHRADLFAFGCVLYEMLAGRRAFEGDTAADHTTAVLTKEPPEISKQRDDIPVALERIVFRCLEKDPAMRFQSAADLAFALQTVGESSTAAADVTRNNLALAGARAGRVSPRELSAWTFAILALLALSVLALRDWSTERSTVPDAPLVIRSEINPPPGGGGAGIPEISPDGQYLVFHALSGGMWLRALSESSSRRLTGVDDGYRACWSPDSRSVVIVAGNRLKLVAVPGGQVSTVGAAPWITTSCGWSARGEILLSSIPMPLVTVRVSDGATRALGLTTFPPEPANYVFSNFLPDGRHFIFAVNGAQQPDANGVYIGDAEDRESPVKLSAPGGFPLCTPAAASRSLFAAACCSRAAWTPSTAGSRANPNCSSRVSAPPTARGSRFPPTVCSSSINRSFPSRRASMCSIERGRQSERSMRERLHLLWRRMIRAFCSRRRVGCG